MTLARPVRSTSRPPDEVWEEIQDALNITWDEEEGRILEDAAFMGIDEDQALFIWPTLARLTSEQCLKVFLESNPGLALADTPDLDRYELAVCVLKTFAEE